MFKFLKEKFTGWLGKDQDKEKEKPKVDESKEVKKEKQKPEPSPKKPAKTEKSVKEDKVSKETKSPVKDTVAEVQVAKSSGKEAIVDNSQAIKESKQTLKEAVAVDDDKDKVIEVKPLLIRQKSQASEIKETPSKAEIADKKAEEAKEEVSQKEVSKEVGVDNKTEVKEEAKSEMPQVTEVKLEKKSFFAKIKEKFTSEEKPAESKLEKKTSDSYSPPEMIYADTTKYSVEKTPLAPADTSKNQAETQKEPEEIIETLKAEEAPQEGFFSKLKQKLTTSELKKEEFEELFQEMEITLLENNVALEVVDKIRESLAKDLVGIQVKKSEADTKILSSLKSAISQVLIESPDLIEKIKVHNGRFVILFFGINGTGKTTSIAKLAWKLKQEGISCVLAAADTFRAASIEQLETHANKIQVPIIKSEYGKDPSSVAFDAIKFADKNKIKVVLIDTAGRMYTQGNLMREMEKIVKVSQPDMKIFVGESITGNDALDQARSFNETAGIDGIILSKADVDDKSGTILSVSYITQKPILFLGVGQEYKDLQVFSKDQVLKGLGLE